MIAADNEDQKPEKARQNRRLYSIEWPLLSDRLGIELGETCGLEPTATVATRKMVKPSVDELVKAVGMGSPGVR